ncbi:rhsC element core protein RshC, partial [Escherichia coli O26:H11 str. CVM10021]
DERGWLTDISHISEGHRVTVHYGYDSKGRLPVTPDGASSADGSTALAA